jgi:carbonic anhydrase
VSFVTQAIAPAVKEAAQHPGDLLENTLRAHAALVVDALRRTQPVLAPAAEAGRLRVVGARYDLNSGLVEVIVP